ncbi:MAG TPA: 3'-5' exonuclease, partial [Candidatus Elarobacter sp.]|nr:3'-5' exonuclease [Candidatus Elarobacter sp.]
REVSWTHLRPRHIALLFRTRTAIPYFERALAERGVPYVTAAGQGFYERAEVLDCIMLLRAVAQPLDDLAMAALLRSPFVGATDLDLWRLRALCTTGKHPRPLYTALPRYAPLADFRAAFHALRKRTRGLPASLVLEDAIRRFGYETALAAHEDGPAMLANLSKVRRQVRDMGMAPPYEAYVALEHARELMANEPMAALVGPSDDVIVLTTIHQAKGLEWPIVCLPNLQAAASGRTSQFSGRHGVLLCDALDDDCEPAAPASLREIREEVKARADAEERRLLYVALTRARERLILSASVPDDLVTAPGKAPRGDEFRNPLAFLLNNTGDRLMAGGTARDPMDTRVELVTDSDISVTQLLSGESLAESLTLGEPIVIAPDFTPPPELPLSVKVTELLAYRRCAQVYRFSHVLEIEEHLPRRAAIRGERKRTVSPVELGTIVHGLLERAQFDASDPDVEAERLLVDQPSDLHEPLRRLLFPVLTGEVASAVRSATRVEREWPFAFELGGVLVEGVIDLAVQGADGTWTVFDYKSNDFSRSGRLEYLQDYYTPQLELYALALSRAGIGAVTGCALVFLTGSVVHRWSFDPASGIGDWAQRTIRRIAAGDYTASAGPQCELCGYRKRKVCDIGRRWTPAAGLPTPDALRVTDAT